MKLRRGTAEAELLDDEQRRTKLESDLERGQASLANAQAAVVAARQAEADAMLDDSDMSAARKRRVDAEAALAAATGDLDVLRRALAQLERRIEASRERVRAEQLAAETAKLRELLATNVEASKSYASKHAEAVDAKRALQASRERVLVQQRVVLDLGGERLEADEAVWNDADELVEFLSTVKPRTPLADAEKAERQRELDAGNEKRRRRQRALDDARALAALSWGPDETQRRRSEFFDGLDDDVRDEAREIFERERQVIRSRRSPSFARG